jgi:acetyl coenzyme A synthetase (ADP forming)-like protein
MSTQGSSKNLAAFFNPRSVAVIGASRDPTKVGGSVVANLRAAGFEGHVYPVNPRTDVVQGLPATASLLAIDGPVDLAVIAVPATAVLPALKECVAKGIRGAIVISAGFREASEAGQAREAELRAWLRGQPIRVLGPNCLGWIRPSRRLNATFAPGMPAAGGIAFLSHSGALATAILDWARARRLGFSFFATLGNQADLTESDVLEAAANDPETRVIVAYLEGLADGRRFFEALGATTARKPVVLLKAGRSPEGGRAISSHTGAIAGSDVAFEAAVRQAGGVRARSVEELFDLARCLASQPLPCGRRLLVVTNGGGLGVIATDAARDAGLEVAALPSSVQAKLRTVLPPTASLANPVDLVGDADPARYTNALHAVGPEAGVDAALVIMTVQAATDAVGVARAILGAIRGWSRPVVAALVGGDRVAPGIRILEEAGLPCYPFPEPAVTAIAGMALVAERARPEMSAPRLATTPADARAAFEELRVTGAEAFGLSELTPLLTAYGISVLMPRLAGSAEEAAVIAGQLNCPVALKIASPDISHKTDIGGVSLGLTSPAEVARIAAAMLARVRQQRPDAAIRGFIVQPMAPSGKELLLGALHDPQFGPLVVVGFGGIYVEVLRDTTARLAPLSPAEALRMLDELRMAPLLRGVRGQPGVDRAALAETIVRFGQLAADYPELVELELNPLVAHATGVVAVDARATLTSSLAPSASAAKSSTPPTETKLC